MKRLCTRAVTKQHKGYSPFACFPFASIPNCTLAFNAILSQCRQNPQFHGGSFYILKDMSARKKFACTTRLRSKSVSSSPNNTTNTKGVYLVLLSPLLPVPPCPTVGNAGTGAVHVRNICTPFKDIVPSPMFTSAWSMALRTSLQGTMALDN